MIRSLILLFSLCLALGSSAQEAREAAFRSPEAKVSAFAHTKLSYKITPAANGTWCYDIYSDGRMLIHQSSMPGVPGINGFRTKEGAAKVAQLVIAKIRKGAMPPTVEISEMKKLNVIE